MRLQREDLTGEAPPPELLIDWRVPRLTEKQPEIHFVGVGKLLHRASHHRAGDAAMAAVLARDDAADAADAHAAAIPIRLAQCDARVGTMAPRDRRRARGRRAYPT
ncbi:MAG TPA: hypothetical protein VKX28_20090 [Xanthobacteraceae bacterium]|nr:hypothetical protein [Xanthobacteraceae bacterium]